MRTARFDAKSCSLDEITAALDEQGYAVITGALSEAALGALRGELEPHFERRPDSRALFFGFHTKRIEGLLAKSATARDMALHSLVFAAAEHVLKPNCDSLQINLTQGIRINPGELAQILHPDSAMFPISNKPFEFMVNAMWAYSDFTAENGATRLVPGSHKWPEGRVPRPEETVSADMPAGSVLIYRGSLIHGGGANRTDAPRTGVAIGYSLGWLRQSENQYLSYPAEVARHFSEPLRRLIGYNVHRPNLGWVGGRDPTRLIDGTDAEEQGAEDFLTEAQQTLIREFRAGADAALTSHDLKAA
jgi:ectoine hydroxylase-related dioxygenase (phytanoyl-CoA dioxygenase family)